MSSSLLWELTKINSCYLKSGNYLTFSKDPLNTTGRNCFKHSGLVNKEAINVTKDENNKIVLLTKSQKKNKQNKPSKLVNKANLSGGKRRSLSSIRNVIKSNNMKKELTKVVLRKASALMKAKSNKTEKK